ncbi:N-acetyl-gamma-glutamyl-phosphate reductase [Chakrabartyella piscis]|uniref:N-acetyl-gamma-glutamyl-phosphate reductase n=1 Tax=Chakrabartyella piscis TaxID=2918914 RepID=UPI002958D1AF|nr:N-acetyl-gamma-glutamyl-phosphate reductase [Chakrabartyella piscis]
MKYTVYIDGQEGTTGLQLRQKLEHHPNIELILIAEALRKDEAERKRLMNGVDVVFLCLPDGPAKEAVALVENPNVCVIDASTAHRTNPDWTYGFPELSKTHRQNLQTSKRIANPGCHATGFIASVYPLVAAGILPKDYPFTCHSMTGYSGGGKGMIAEYESEDRHSDLDSPRQYGVAQVHKHLPEMKAITGIDSTPVFCPIVSDFYGGMATTVPLHASLFQKKATKDEVFALLQGQYADSAFIDVTTCESGFLAANPLVNTNKLTIYVDGNDERMTLTCVFDNLGKGASGAAIQNMNIALGLDETTALM